MELRKLQREGEMTEFGHGSKLAERERNWVREKACSSKKRPKSWPEVVEIGHITSWRLPWQQANRGFHGECGTREQQTRAERARQSNQQQAEAAAMGVQAVGEADGGQKKRSRSHGCYGRELSD